MPPDTPDSRGESSTQPPTVHDAHCHFFSRRFFEAIGREKYGREAGIGAAQIAAELGWDEPGEPAALAERWIDELGRHRVSRAALIASVPGDEESVAAAVAGYPDRFVGYFMLNPTAPDSRERAERALTVLGFRCICLFPALHRYRLDELDVTNAFKIAATYKAAMFVHCGYFSVEARAKLGLPSVCDLRLGDPLALAATAVHFPGVPVIVPHFGAGFFREALMAAEMCPTIHLDTSSSNGWVKYVPGLTVTEVFRRVLSVVGPDRVLFGTDSSYFPRGWRRVIYGAQRTALDELGIEPDARARIFAGNFERLFGPVSQPVG